MSTNHTGLQTVALQGIQRNWTQSGGWQSTYSYKGTWANIELARVNSAYVANAASVTVSREDGDYGVLDVTFAAVDNESASVTSNTPESDVWGLQPSKVQRNVWEDPYFDDLDDDRQTYSTNSTYDNSPYNGYKYRLRTAVDAYLARVQSNIEGGTKDTNKLDLDGYLDEWSNATGMSSTQKQKALDLVNLLLNGKDTDEYPRYVLRNTRILPGNTSTQVAHDNVNKQWTNAALVAYIYNTAIPTITRHTMVGDLATVFAGTYWLKESPVVNDVHGGKTELVQEWVNYAPKELSSLLHNYHG